jgi:hypothetical protein
MNERNSWENMRQRCNYPKHAGFRHYGGRGIKVCARWSRFKAFLEDMGPKPSPQHSLDRIDNDGDYEPGNCRWATKQEQIYNSNLVRPVQRSDGKLYASVSIAAREVGVPHSNIWAVCHGRRRTSAGYGWAYS